MHHQVSSSFFLTFALTSSLIACGSSAASSTTAPQTGADTSGGATTTTTAAAGGSEHSEHGEHHEHPSMPPAVHAYHEVLRPLWHSALGPERDNQVCAQVGTLVTHANAITAAGAPAGGTAEQSTRYTAAATQLATTTLAVQTTCTATPRGNVAGSFEVAHTAFHGLMETLPSGH